MPVTPLHLGPGGLLGLLFRRRLDLPVFLMTNLVVDVEVWVAACMKVAPTGVRYGHTLLVSGAVGLVAAAPFYPLRGPMKKALGRIGLPYETGFLKMLVSGLLGAWTHVLADGLYRSNVVLFWPSRIPNPLCRFDKTEVETACAALLAVSLVFGAALLRKRPAGKGAGRASASGSPERPNHPG